MKKKVIYKLDVSLKLSLTDRLFIFYRKVDLFLNKPIRQANEKVSISRKIYRFFFPPRYGIVREAATSMQEDEDGNQFISRRFYTFRALYTHFVWTFFVNPVKDLIQGIVTPGLSLAFRVAFVILILQGVHANADMRHFTLVGGAIAFDATTTPTQGTTSFSHTVSGSNTMLAVAVGDQFGSTTAMTFNSNSMTKQSGQTGGGSGYWSLIYGQLAPTSGSHTVANTGMNNGSLHAISYSGVLQSGLPDATAQSHGDDGATSSVAPSVVASNCWIVGHGGCQNVGTNTGTITIGGGICTLRATQRDWGTFHGVMFDSNGTVGTGSQSTSISGSGNSFSSHAASAFSFAPAVSAPTVTTSAASSITPTTATGNGNVTSDGGATVTERGVVWSTSANPTTSDSKATAAGTTGAYTASMTGLSGATLYHYRAYAINSVGTSYGADTTFTTGTAYTKNLTENETHTDTISKLPSRTFSERVTDTDTLIRVPSRTLSENETHTDTLANVRIRNGIFTETQATIDTLIRNIGAVFTETETFIDTFIRMASRTLRDSFSSTDTLSKTANVVLTEAQTTVDSIVRTMSRTITEVVTDTDTFIGNVLHVRIFTESFSSIDTVAKLIGRTLYESFFQRDLLQLLRNGVSALWNNIYSKQGTTFNDKYPKGSTNWQDKFH